MEMSFETLPITPVAFAEAIKELPLPVLYAKVAELRNCIAHLQRSNQELRLFITESCENDADKRELEEYIRENEGVNESMNERIRLCKAEVEGRGQAWIELDPEANANTGTEGEGEQGQNQEQPGSESTAAATVVNGPGSRTDAPPTERPRDREDDDDNGVYL